MQHSASLPAFSKRGQKIMRVLLAIFWLMPILVFCLIVFLAPLNVLDSWPFAQAFCHQIQTWVSAYWPSGGPFNHVRGTTFPQVARLATAWAVLAWIPMTAFTLLITTVLHKRLRRDTLSQETTTKKIKLIAAGLIIPFLCIYGFFFLPGDPSFAKGLTTGSRIGYAFMGTLAILFSSFCPSFLPLCIASLCLDPALGKSAHR
jgi:hypothetical protein